MMLLQMFSKWFYIGILGIILGIILIIAAKNNVKSKKMENGYFILILGLIGVISEWLDFSNILFIFVIVCIIVIIFDKLYLSKIKNYESKSPHYVYYSKEFFPVLLVVFILRSFLFEGYKIPSSSMYPNLMIGDYILVEKFAYGIRNPINNRIMLPTKEIQRGDVVVFKDPNARNRDLIKRVIGLPGDIIKYQNKQLTINNVNGKYTDMGSYEYIENDKIDNDFMVEARKLKEDLFGYSYDIIIMDQLPTLLFNQIKEYKNRKNCVYYGDNGFSCTVPKDHYFMMGDNRDNSEDSRYIGFISIDAVLGKAIYVWLNFSNFKRFGTKI